MLFVLVVCAKSICPVRGSLTPKTPFVSVSPGPGGSGDDSSEQDREPAHTDIDLARDETSPNKHIRLEQSDTDSPS